MKKAILMSALAFAGACSEQPDVDSAEQDVIGPQHMSDATTGGTADFYFLVPTAPSDPTTFSGPFNSTFSSRLRVDILDADCATWTTSTTAYTFNTVGVYVTISAYRASATLATMGLQDHHCYRIQPTLDGQPLGYRDVMFDSSPAAPPAGVLKWKGTGNQIISFTLRNQVDTDNDGVPNNIDQCPTTAGDPSNNGCPIIDNCPTDPNKLEPGICGCEHADVDSDGDGNYAGDGSFSAQCSDLCDTDSAKSVPGACGCGAADVDADGDGNYAGSGSVPGCTDQCDDDARKSAPGSCGCGSYPVDFNEDGTIDGCTVPNSCSFNI